MLATYLRVLAFAATASLLTGTLANAENSKDPQEPFKVNCLVYDGSGDEPVFLADKSLKLQEHHTEVVYEKGPLKYVVSYESFGDDTPEDQFYAIGLLIEDTSRDLKITSLSGTGRSWIYNAHLVPPFNLPHFDCTPDYGGSGKQKVKRASLYRRASIRALRFVTDFLAINFT